MHTAEFFEKFDSLDFRTTESDSWCALCSVHHTVHTTLKMSNFVFTNLLRLSTTFYQKRSEIKKIPFKICDLQYNFHSIFVKTSQRNINCKILDQNTHLTSN